MPRGLPPSELATHQLRLNMMELLRARAAGKDEGNLLAEMTGRSRAMFDQDMARERAERDPTIRSMKLADNPRTFMNRASGTVVDAVDPILELFSDKPTFDEWVADPATRISENIEDRRAYDWGMPHYDPNHAPRHEPWREWIDGSITGPLVGRR